MDCERTLKDQVVGCAGGEDVITELQVLVPLRALRGHHVQAVRHIIRHQPHPLHQGVATHTHTSQGAQQPGQVRQQLTTAISQPLIIS